MFSDIATGNAKDDAKEFRFWFVGQIDKWCKDNNIPFDREQYGLRQTDSIEIKWGMYKKNEGDYAIWREDVEHTWEMLEDSETLTLRWQSDKS